MTIKGEKKMTIKEEKNMTIKGEKMKIKGEIAKNWSDSGRE